MVRLVAGRLLRTLVQYSASVLVTAGTFWSTHRVAMCAIICPSSSALQTTTSCCQACQLQLQLQLDAGLCRSTQATVAAAAGWNHFSQFTIAVVNKDPKKSKYSGAQPGSTHAA